MFVEVGMVIKRFKRKSEKCCKKFKKCGKRCKGCPVG